MAQKLEKHLSAADAFRINYADLHSALSSPTLPCRLASNLYKSEIITADTRDAVQFTLGISPAQQAAKLLQAVESSIKMDQRRLQQFIRELKKENALKPIALKLCQNLDSKLYFCSKDALHCIKNCVTTSGKLVSGGQSETYGSESEAEVIEHQR